MKRLLVIAYYFPPSCASGVFRTLAFVRHLSANGWDITVLTLDPPTSSKEGQLLARVPENVRVVRARERDLFYLWTRLKKSCIEAGSKEQGASVSSVPPCSAGSKNQGMLATIKEQCSSLVKIPDSQAGWFFPALFKGRSLEKPDVIYSSAPPFTGHVVGALLKKKWKVPLVVDFRDPWGGNPFRPSYGGFAERWDRILEQWVMRASNRILANTKPMADMIKQRFPAYKNKVSVLTNGFDPEEFEGIQPFREFPPERFLLVHPGVLYGKRNPLPFLRAVRDAVHEKGMRDILVVFIGQYESFEGKALETHLKEMRLTEHVLLLPPMSHDRVFSVMKGADLLLLLALGTTLQVPAKLFEYMGIGKPIFGICEPESATLEIMRGLGEGHAWMLNNQGDILHQLEQIYRDWHNGVLHCNGAGESTMKPFLRYNLAMQLHQILNEECTRGVQES
ncbi:glycosyltransferase [Thermodesulfobacteriota bacterium B35]